MVAGRGEMWRRGEREEVVALAPGMALTIPVGTHFQFQAGGRLAGRGGHHHAAVAGG